MSADLHHTRYRLAKLRDELKQCVASLKPSSTACKVMRGRWGGVMDAIEIVDQELLAEEQGEPTVLRPDQVAWLAQQRGGK